MVSFVVLGYMVFQLRSFLFSVFSVSVNVVGLVDIILYLFVGIF